MKMSRFPPSGRFCVKLIRASRFFMLLPLAFLLAGCTTVERVDANKVMDLSGYWNDTDIRLACDSLIKSCLEDSRVAQATKALGRNPVFLVGRFRNESDEHIDTSIIADRMESAIFSSGKANFVAGGAARESVREERQDQQTHASEATASKLGNETGADFLLTGTIKVVEDRKKKTLTRTYYVRAQLTDVETDDLLWLDDYNEIKKLIKISSVRP
jgi:uncharacterized protein (TIGR02722 family)